MLEYIMIYPKKGLCIGDLIIFVFIPILMLDTFGTKEIGNQLHGVTHMSKAKFSLIVPRNKIHMSIPM